MTPVSPSRCFGRDTELYRIFSENGFDVSAAANALGRWLCSDVLDFLYIQPFNYEVGQAFMRDLREAIGHMDEIGFVDDFRNVLRVKARKKVAMLPPYCSPVTIFPRHIILRFANSFSLPRRFSPLDLAVFLYCGNTEEGPDPVFECEEENGYICIDRDFGCEASCGKCFEMGIAQRLREPWLREDFSNEVDEGVVAEPLGLPSTVYRWHLNDYDFSDE